MKDLHNFYKEVEGKKERLQRREVQFMRFASKYIPKKFSRLIVQTSDFMYLTICRKNDFDMVEASLYSLFKNSKLQPSRIMIVSDGSWLKEEAINYFKHTGLPVESCVWDECVENNVSPTDEHYDYKSHLAAWAKAHIWGKKMACILHFAEHNKVLFSDPDILWYNTPLTQKELETCPFKVSIDNCHSYDQELLKYLKAKRLNEREPINCGAVFIHGGIDTLPEIALKAIEYEAQHCGPFAEQTVFALMDEMYDNRWSMDEITSKIDDVIAPFFSKTNPDKNLIARHYLWRLKWIYWKEYLRMLVE